LHPEDVPWRRPSFEAQEPPGQWWTGRAARQEAALRRLKVLQDRLAAGLNRPSDDPIVLRAAAEIGMGATIEIDGWRFTKISDASVAISEPADRETYFLNLDAGTQV
jgi:hypothetical protein